MDDVLDALERPDWVSRGYDGALIAWKGYGLRRFLAVVYREVDPADGFVVTAFFTSKPRKRGKIWP